MPVVELQEGGLSSNDSVDSDVSESCYVRWAIASPQFPIIFCNCGFWCLWEFWIWGCYIRFCSEQWPLSTSWRWRDVWIWDQEWWTWCELHYQSVLLLFFFFFLISKLTFAKNPCLSNNGCSSATYWTRNLPSTVISGSTVTGGSTFSVSTDWIRKATVIGGSMFSVSDSQFGRTPTKLSSPPVRQIRKQLLLSFPWYIFVFWKKLW